MFRLKIAFFALAVTFAHWTTLHDSADAGLLRDWLNRRRARRAARNCTPPSTGPYVSTAGANPYGLQPGQCATTCQQTCSRVVVNYVPCTSYRTTYQRVPVTQYRPQTTADPCTGCSVTCMRPCTTYTYRMCRVPYTTYRPVYRTENYRVPLTTISNNCNTCATGGCNATPGNACSTGIVGQQVVPNGTLTTDGSFGSLPAGSTITPLPTPADNTPTLNPQNSNRSVIESPTGSSTRIEVPSQDSGNWALTSTTSSNRDWSSVPVSNVATTNPVTRKWKYSPVKQASYVSLDANAGKTQKMKTIRGSFSSVNVGNAGDDSIRENVNQGWETVNW